ncbi:MAG TPA: protein-glutamate O-methyltransferase CheR [Candidatus Limnocylindrales bacterium]|nr:protein-glutamate O-methyltransferase CheR [Candidatus Limnocylindrales bacterium]
MQNKAGPLELRVPEGLPRLLRDLIHERTGLFFDDGRMDQLLEKLETPARARGCRSFLEYYYALKDDENGEWDRAWIALSVQETYFWREMSQIHALTNVIIPQWFKKSSMPFRIWSAACATGEEPFTLAIALREAGFQSHPIEILGTDAHLGALEKARIAVYREKSFRTLPPELQQKYFERVADGWKLSREIVERVSWKRINLFEPGEVASVARAHAIFCRNVFIYFSPHSIRQTVAMIASKMPVGGHLFVGAAESLLRMTTDFELKEISGALAYVRI